MKFFPSLSTVLVFLLLSLNEFTRASKNHKIRKRKHKLYKSKFPQQSQTKQPEPKILCSDELTAVKVDNTANAKTFNSYQNHNARINPIPNKKSLQTNGNGQVTQSNIVKIMFPEFSEILNGDKDKNDSDTSSLSVFLNESDIFEDENSTLFKTKLTNSIIDVLKRGLRRSSPHDIITYGSLLFHASKKSSDVDLMGICPMGITRDEFFTELIAYFNHSSFDNSILWIFREAYLGKFLYHKFSFQYISTARLPIIKLNFDIQLTEDCADKNKNVNLRFDIAMVNIRSIPEKTENLVEKEVECMEKAIQNSQDFANLIVTEGLFSSLVVKKLFDSDVVYQNTLKFLKLWAERKGLYDSQLGFFKGFHLTVMLLYIRTSHSNIKTDFELLVKFVEYYGDHWDFNFIVPPLRESVSNISNYGVPVYAPLIYYPVHKGKPMIDRMPYSASQIILFEIEKLRNALTSVQDPACGIDWSEIVKATIPFDVFSQNSSKVMTFAVQLVYVFPKEELTLKFLSFIHSQLFKFIQSLEDPANSIYLGGSQLRAGFETKDVVVVNHQPNDPTFKFKLFLSERQYDFDHEKARIERTWNNFLEMIQSIFMNRYDSIMGVQDNNSNFQPVKMFNDSFFSLNFNQSI